MKLPFFGWLLLAFIAGCLTQWIVLPHPGRYTVAMQSEYLIRTDTATGQTWRFQGGWIAMPESK